ncbi:MAG: pyruvate kinase [Bacillota bacterium]
MQLRRTKIVCTLGPSTESPDTIAALIRAGMDVARFNLSHGDHDIHRRRLRALREAENITGKHVGVLFDTKGPEIRLGRFRDGRAELKKGSSFKLTIEPVLGNDTICHVTYAGIVSDVAPGATILLDDGNVTLRVERVEGGEVVCTVLHEGVVSDKKKVTLPGTRVSLPAVSEEDVADLEFAVSERVEFVAASFIRSVHDVLSVRKVLESRGGDQLIIAKIENKEACENIEEILKVSDGIMVARGDLGVEVPAEEVPLIQKNIIERCNRAGKPVITATQMLESMINRPRPTRAEASDVANAILDGTDAVMLSGETAVGSYPTEAVTIMAKIAARTEEALAYEEILARRRTAMSKATTTTDAISYATTSIAASLRAAAIITPSQSGHTARMVAKYRPRSPIVAVTPDERVARRLSLVWGVTSCVEPAAKDTDAMMREAWSAALDAGLIQEGDLVVITAGVPVGVPGTTNMIKVHTVGSILVRGMGIGSRPVSGTVRLIRSAEEAGQLSEGEILVTAATDRDFVPAMQRASAVVTEAGGLTSHAAIVCLNLGIPVIVGAEGALGILKDGMRVTIDTPRGLIYRGEAQVV